MKQRIITNIATAPDGLHVEYVEREDMREPGYVLTRSLSIPAEGEVGDRIDRLLRDAEVLLDVAIADFDAATPVEDRDVAFEGSISERDPEEVDTSDPEVSPWDNPEERDLSRAEQPPGRATTPVTRLAEEEDAPPDR